MPNTFFFEVHTPYRPFFIGKAQAITLTLTDGEIAVYAKHSPFTAPVISCILRIRDDKGKWRSAFITEGILEVKYQKNVLIVDAAEWPEEIDRDRALAAKQKAEESIKASSHNFKIVNAETQLRRAESRLKACELR